MYFYLFYFYSSYFLLFIVIIFTFCVYFYFYLLFLFFIFQFFVPRTGVSQQSRVATIEPRHGTRTRHAHAGVHHPVISASPKAPACYKVVMRSKTKLRMEACALDLMALATSQTSLPRPRASSESGAATSLSWQTNITLDARGPATGLARSLSRPRRVPVPEPRAARA